MSNPLAISLGPTGSQSASGTGAAVDIGALRTAVRLTLEVTELAGDEGGLLKVEVETSADGSSGWRLVAAFEAVTALASLESCFGPLARFVRVRWTFDGVTSATFTVAGEAHVVYANPRNIRGLGVKGVALNGVSDSVLAEFCIVASVEADGYLQGGKQLPLSKWDIDLTLHTAKLAFYHYANAKGRQPTGPDDIIDLGYANAIKWLKGVASGAIDPPGMVDATPEVNEASFAVVSGPATDWGV